MYTSYLVDQKLCEPLEEVVDSDVAGWGVITAFTTAIFLTISVIVIAYLLLAMPTDRYQPVDRLFLRIMGLSIPDPPPTSDCRINTQDHSGIASVPSAPDSRNETNILEPRYNNTTETKWKRASKALVLGMGGQQLFTGMALMISMLLMTAGLNNLNESLSVYSFKVVTMLAYFSFIIQLCSLTVIPNGHGEKKPLRYFRVGVMLVFLLLLIFCMIVSQSVTFRFNSNVSVKCALQNLHMVDPQRPGYTVLSDEAIIFFNLLVLIAIIMLEYLRRVRELLKQEPSDNYSNTNPTSEPTTDPGIELTNNSATTEPTTSPTNRTNVEHRFWLYFGLENFESSFLLELIWMLFYFTFGLANLFKFLVDQHANIGAIEPNFGQLVPIFLLAHPFLSASEALSRPNLHFSRSSTLPVAEASLPFSLKAKLLCVIVIYASVLVVWALMFAAVIPRAYPLSALACVYAAVAYRWMYWKYVRKLLNTIWAFLQYLKKTMERYRESCIKKKK